MIARWFGAEPGGGEAPCAPRAYEPHHRLSKVGTEGGGVKASRKSMVGVEISWPTQRWGSAPAEAGQQQVADRQLVAAGGVGPGSASQACSASRIGRCSSTIPRTSTSIHRRKPPDPGQAEGQHARLVGNGPPGRGTALRSARATTALDHATRAVSDALAAQLGEASSSTSSPPPSTGWRYAVRRVRARRRRSHPKGHGHDDTGRHRCPVLPEDRQRRNASAPRPARRRRIGPGNTT